MEPLHADGEFLVRIAQGCVRVCIECVYEAVAVLAPSVDVLCEPRAGYPGRSCGAGLR